ncbi:MAG: cytochrome c oxidase subunit II [Caldilinea sp. CFX5]|nr:cytochrome c oxidase subunit II [Caldilinea sp. CFX5]
MKLRERSLLFALLGLSLWTGACQSATRVEPDIPSALDPQGPAAATIANLWWILFWLGTAVFVVVTALLLLIVFTHRRRGAILEPDLQAPEHRTWIWWGGIISPAIILGVTLFFTLRSHIALAYPPTPPVTTIEIVGRLWWWEVRYPDHNIVTANEIYIPVGQPVQLRLTAAEVIHSFWVPELHGKMDMIPGKINTLWIQADTPGDYRGLCTEFCGRQHAKMQFILVATPPTAFNRWIEQQQQPAVTPTDPNLLRGQQVFLASNCVYCHAVQGTAAQGNLGPDLTHLASRRTLGAGAVVNNRGNLGGWIANPQHIKPGNLMPAARLTAPELQAMLDYLVSLR